MANLIKIRFKPEKILYPKSGHVSIGEYSIVSCQLLEQITNTEKIILSKWGNFILTTNNSPAYKIYDEYTATVVKVVNKYGVGYKVVSSEEDYSIESEGSKRAFLEAFLTPFQVNRLFETYKDPYEIIKNEDVEGLMRCKGIKKTTAQKIIQKYKENLGYARLLVELKDYNLTKTTINKLIATYGNTDTILAKIKENIYVLAEEVSGIGFKKCDAIAMKIGIDPQSPFRLQSFFCYFLEQMAQAGNSWVKPKYLFGAIYEYLQTYFENDVIKESLYKLHDEQILYWNEEKTKIGLKKYYDLERDIALNLSRLNEGSKCYKRNPEVEQEIIKKIEEEIGFQFTNEQKNAINSILDNNVSTLVGYAGTGKSQLIKVLVNIFNTQKLYSKICALAGKASARVEEVTGFKGETIHRALGYTPMEGFSFNKETPLDCEVVIVDETSMVGGELFLSLIEAIPTGAKLILVGDNQQLPSIGTCNIFQDIIDSNKFNNATLTQIHRQAQDSGIIMASKMVREQEQLVSYGWEGKETRGVLQDFTIDILKDKMFGRNKLLDYYKSVCKTLEDTMETQIVLCMKNKGETSTYEINNEIQRIYNPPSPDKKEVVLKKGEKNIILREGDRVVNRKNDYSALPFRVEMLDNNIFQEPDENDKKDREQVFNGFDGRIIKIIDNTIVVQFALVERPIVFSYGKLSNLELSYAITVHVSQGSQWENVLFYIDYGSYIMNNKELVYTAITRASKYCVLIAESQALHGAIKTSQTNNKQTYLIELLDTM